MERGLALVELMIPLPMSGTLAAIAARRSADLLHKAHEGAAKRSLGSIRSALSICCADTSEFPRNLDALTLSGNYQTAMPRPLAPHYHSITESVTKKVSSNDGSGRLCVSAPTGQNSGTLRANCTHTDTNGGIWPTH